MGIESIGAGECAVRIFKRLWHSRSGKPFPEGETIPPGELAIIAGEIENWTFYPRGGRLAELERLKKLVKEHRYDYAETDRVVQCSCGWKAPVEREDGWEHWTEHLLEVSLAAK